MTESEIKILVERAAELGARRALRNIGLSDEDVSELRGLLDSWRTAKRTVGKTLIQGITTLILGGLIAGSYFNFFQRS